MDLPVLIKEKHPLSPPPPAPFSSTNNTIPSFKSTFLSLPSELRHQIYHHAIPTCRLAPFPYIDPDWSMTVPSPHHRGIPSLLFVSRLIHAETLPLIYSRAILEVAPAQQGYSFFDLKVVAPENVNAYTYRRVSDMFRFYRRDCLRLVRRVRIYSNQADVVDGHSYESLLGWLVENTGVEEVRVSKRVMTRIRGKACFELERWRRVFCARDGGGLDDGDGVGAGTVTTKTDASTHANANTYRPVSRGLRLVRVWTESKRPPWEYEKMMRLRCRASDGTLIPVQIYFWSLPELISGEVPKTDVLTHGNVASRGILQLDPRWLTRLNDNQERIEEMEMAGPIIDRLMGEVLVGRELQDYKDTTRHFVDISWVYQMIVVAQP